MDDLIFRSAAIEAMTADNLNRNLDSVHDDDMKRAARAAQRALARIPAAQRWIAVTERLPERRQVVIAIGEKGTWDVGMFTGLAFSNLDPSEWNWKKNTIKTVKWWMPKENALPEPPKEEP